MSNPAQRKFCKSVKSMYPEYFRRVNVVDVGSLDINGSNRGLFRRSNYTGIDVYPGKNVDLVGPAHIVLPAAIKALSIDVSERYRRRTDGAVFFDTIISTEALEHDKYFEHSLVAMYNALRPGGLLLITAAGEGRPEHGTSNERPQDSPGTNDYYCNVTNQMFSEVLPPTLFDVYYLAQDKENFDIQFYGVKKY